MAASTTFMVVRLLLIVAGLLFVTQTCATEYSLGGGREINEEMDSLVDGVRKAVQDAERSKSGKEVLDLGQSLHILEHKFAGLKAAIAHQMGTKLNSPAAHSEEAKQMVDTATKLLDEMAMYRTDMEHLLDSLRDIESGIGEAKSGMSDFDREVDDMNRLLKKLHVATDQLQDNHDHIHGAIEDNNLMMESHVAKGGHHFWFMLVLLVEAAAVCYFIYSKKGGFKSAKTLHKF